MTKATTTLNDENDPKTRNNANDVQAPIRRLADGKEAPPQKKTKTGGKENRNRKRSGITRARKISGRNRFGRIKGVRDQDRVRRRAVTEIGRTTVDQNAPKTGDRTDPEAGPGHPSVTTGNRTRVAAGTQPPGRSP